MASFHAAKWRCCTSAFNSKVSYRCSKIFVHKITRSFTSVSDGKTRPDSRRLWLRCVWNTNRKEIHNPADFKVWKPQKIYYGHTWQDEVAGDKPEFLKLQRARGGKGWLRYSTFPSEIEGNLPNGKGEVFQKYTGYWHPVSFNPFLSHRAWASWLLAHPLPRQPAWVAASRFPTGMDGKPSVLLPKDGPRLSSQHSHFPSLSWRREVAPARCMLLGLKWTGLLFHLPWIKSSSYPGRRHGAGSSRHRWWPGEAAFGNWDPHSPTSSDDLREYLRAWKQGPLHNMGLLCSSLQKTPMRIEIFLICRGAPKEMSSYRPIPQLEEGRIQDGNKATKKGRLECKTSWRCREMARLNLRSHKLELIRNRSQPSQDLNPDQRSPPLHFSPHPTYFKPPKTTRLKTPPKMPVTNGARQLLQLTSFWFFS